MQNSEGLYLGSPGGSAVKNLLTYAGDADSVPGSVRSSGEESSNPLQDSCLENPREERGAWRVTVQGVAKSRTRLSD